MLLVVVSHVETDALKDAQPKSQGLINQTYFFVFLGVLSNLIHSAQEIFDLDQTHSRSALRLLANERLLALALRLLSLANTTEVAHQISRTRNRIVRQLA